MTRADRRPKHARLAPSSAERWLECTGSPTLISTIEVVDEDSVYAQEGTAAHEVFEGCNRAETEAVTLVGMKTSNGWEVTEEMAEAVQTVLDDVRADELTDGGEVFYELEVDTHLHPELRGTLDAALFSPGAQLARVYDLKFGAGILVTVRDNPQAMIYGLGFLEFLGPERAMIVDEIEFVIAQPRRDFTDSDGEDLRTRRWRITKAELLQWRDDVLMPAVAETEADVLTFAPSKQRCRWCPAGHECDALRDAGMAVAKEVFETPALTVDTPGDLARFTATMSSERLGEMLKQAVLADLWIGFLRKHAHARAQSGDRPTGFKLVTKLGNREWNDADAAKAAMIAASELPDATFMTEAKTIEPVILSPAQAEKKWKGGKTVVKSLTRRPERGTVLVDEGDKRPSLARGAEVFDRIDS